MATQVADPAKELALAVVHHAMLDAQEGDPEAIVWLWTDESHFFLDIIDVSPEFIRSWVKGGCSLVSLKALPRYRPDKEIEDGCLA